MMHHVLYINLCLRCVFIVLMISERFQHMALGHICIHDKKQIQNVRTMTINYTNPTRGKRAASALYKHIRITPYYYDLSSLDTDGQEKVKVVISKAINVVKHVLSVIPVSGPLILSRTFEKYCLGTLGRDSNNSGKCSVKKSGYEYELCGDVQIPNDHLEGAWLWNSTHNAPIHVIKPQGSGIPNTDIIIYVTTSECESESTLAHATFCSVDQNGRPIAGVLNLCPHSLQDSTDDDKFTAVAIHEIFHIFGFTQRLYDQFRDCSGSATGLDCPVRENTQLVDARGQSVLVTPKVKEKAHEHFNCSESNYGVPLENHNSKSHWEMRLMTGSIMASVITQADVTFLDPITLALFEDTGWYKANYEHAQNMLWGQDAGCDFGSPDTCAESPFFCTNESVSGCHYLHGDQGTCSTNKFLDSCNLIIVNSDGICSEKIQSDYSQQTKELSSMDSRCFFTDLVNETVTDNQELTGRCYQTCCNKEQETYEILVEDLGWHTCQPNNTLSITGFSGQIYCPSFEIICQNHSSIVNLIHGLPEILETSTMYLTTQYKEPDIFIPKDDKLDIEIVFNATDSYIFDENQGEDFLNEVNQMVLTSTNVSQDRLEVYEMEITYGDVIVKLKIGQSTIQSTTSSYDVYKSLKTVVDSRKFTVIHNNENLTATMIRIVESVVSAPTDLNGTKLAVVVFSTIGSVAFLFLLICCCKKCKAFSRVAPLEENETSSNDSQIKLQPTTTRKNPKM